jgi:hypothetical protein
VRTDHEVVPIDLQPVRHRVRIGFEVILKTPRAGADPEGLHIIERSGQQRRARRQVDPKFMPLHDVTKGEPCIS